MKNLTPKRLTWLAGGILTLTTLNVHSGDLQSSHKLRQESWKFHLNETKRYLQRYGQTAQPEVIKKAIDHFEQALALNEKETSAQMNPQLFTVLRLDEESYLQLRKSTKTSPRLSHLNTDPRSKLSAF